MFKALAKAMKVYLETIDMVAYSSVFILFSLVLLPLVSSYVNAGAAFLRFSSLYRDITIVQLFIFILVGLISILTLSLFLSAIISVVKLKETLDHVAFRKLFDTFQSYVLKVFFFLLSMSMVSVFSGIIMAAIGIPNFIIQMILFIIWMPFVFVPQIIVIDDFDIAEAMDDSWNFVKKFPKAIIGYFLLGVIFVLLIILLETFLGQYFIWEHKILSVTIMALFVLPYLQIFATELYLTRYAVSDM